MYKYMCIRTYLVTNVYIHTHTHMHTRTRVCMHTNVHTSIHTYMIAISANMWCLDTTTLTHTHTPRACVWVCVYMYDLVKNSMSWYKYTHAHTHTCVCVCMRNLVKRLMSWHKYSHTHPHVCVCMCVFACKGGWGMGRARVLYVFGHNTTFFLVYDSRSHAPPLSLFVIIVLLSLVRATSLSLTHVQKETKLLASKIWHSVPEGVSWNKDTARKEVNRIDRERYRHVRGRISFVIIYFF